MVPRTRRSLLQGATALLAGLAGCQGASSGTSRSSDPNDAENVELDPERVSLRNPAGDRAIWIGDDDADDVPRTSEERHHVARRESRLIGSDETAARLRYADVDGDATARTYVDGIDFERETLLLVTRVVEECYRLELCAVTWSSSSYHAYFGRTRRPADVACRVDDTDRVSWLIRIPDVVDPGRIRSRGSGTTSRGCGAYRRRFAGEIAEGVTESASNSTSGDGAGGTR